MKIKEYSLSTKKSKHYDPEHLRSLIVDCLEDNKAEDIIEIALPEHTALGDFMFIASGRSSRQVAAIANHLSQKLKDSGYRPLNVEGVNQGDWVLIDTGDAIIHIFRPEVREFYNLERIWSPEVVNASPSDNTRTAVPA
ncbi:MAG: ribosome silencing factor [Rickettsiales bacterium]|nr:ribosome silencing factor [Rickettsiales bacterium]